MDNNVICMIETIYFNVKFSDSIYKWSDRKHFIEMLHRIRKKAESDEIIIPLVSGKGAIQFYEFPVIKYMPFYITYIIDDDVKFRVAINGNNISSPDMYFMVSSSYLWENSIQTLQEVAKDVIIDILKTLMSMNNTVKELYKNSFQIQSIKIRRWDYAHHNNLIQDLDKYLPYYQANERTLTRLKLGQYYPVKVGSEKVVTETLYFGKSPLKIRIYDKLQEIFKLRYKDWFFQIWLRNGLIDREQMLLLEKAFVNQIKNYRKSIRVEIIKKIKEDFKGLDKIVNDYIDRFESDYKKNKPIYQLFDTVCDYIQTNYDKDYKRYVVMIYNFEIEMRADYFTDIIKKEFELECFDDEDSTESEISDHEQLLILKETLKEKIQNDENIYDDEMLMMKNFGRYAEPLKDYVLEKVFRIIDRKSNKRKDRCVNDPVFEQIRKSRILYLDSKETRNFIKYSLERNSLYSAQKRAVSSLVDISLKVFGDHVPNLDKYDNVYDAVKELELIMQSSVCTAVNYYLSENNLVELERMLEHKRRKYKKNTPEGIK